MGALLRQAAVRACRLIDIWPTLRQLSWQTCCLTLSSSWPYIAYWADLICKVTACVALQLDSHNVMPLLRLSNYYEVSLHRHYHGNLFADAPCWQGLGRAGGLVLPHTLLTGQA